MLRVYLADDSALIRGRLKQALEEQGSIEVVGESGDAEQAILELSRLDPQVVIIDIRMPGGGGMPLLKELKAQRPGCVAIILTAFPSQQYRETYLAAGADYFFDKACDIEVLLSVLQEKSLDGCPPPAGAKSSQGVD